MQHPMRAQFGLVGSNCLYVVCEVDEHEAGISRDLLCLILEAEGILAQRYFNPGCH